MRGWLASGFLAIAVIGGYVGLLPLLSSLSSGPAWPEPIAAREASRVITATDLSGDEPQPETPQGSSDGSEVVVADPDETSTDQEQPNVVRQQPTLKIVGGDMERVEAPRASAPAGDSSSDSGSAPAPSASDSSGGGSDSSGGSAPAAPPAAPQADPFADIGPGELASPNAGGAGSEDEIVSGG